MIYEVMVTQTWAYYHAQLDFAQSRRIKVHIVNSDTGCSYCGLENHTDTGEMSDREIIELDDWACSKCRKAAF